MVLTEPLALVFFRIFSANFRQTKLLAITNCKKTWFFIESEKIESYGVSDGFRKRERATNCATSKKASSIDKLFLATK